MPQRDAPVEVAPPVEGPVSLEVVGRLGGTVSAATLDGDSLYAGTGSQVVQVDLADPARPRQVAESDPLPGQVRDIRPVGELLVVAAGEGGLAVLDRQALSLRGTLALPGAAEAVVVGDGYAYVADGPGGLRIVDIAVPDRPAEIATLLDLHLVLGVAVAGDRAYLAAADEGLVVIDISDPAAPVELGRLFTGGYAFGVALAGERVLLADGWAGLRVIEVSDPRVPRLVTSVPTDGWTLGVRVDGDRAYLADGNRVRVIDLASGDPRIVAGMEFSAFGDSGAAYVTAVDVAGDRAVVVDDTVGIRLLDVGQDRATETGIYAPLAPPVGPFAGLVVSGDRGYLAAGSQGLRIVDVSNPRQPTEVAQIGEPPADIVTAAGTNVFVGAGPYLIGLDTNDRELRPQLRQNVAQLYGNIAGIATSVDGSVIYVAGESGYQILDGGSPVPCRLGFLDMFAVGSEAFTAMGLAGELGYVGGDRFWIVDVADPRAPTLLGTAGVGEGIYRVQGVVGVGQTLYATVNAEVGSAVAVYDLAVPMEPRLQGLVVLPAQPPATSDLRGPVYGGGRLWVADGLAGLVALDVSDPTKPALAGRLRLPGDVMGVAIDGDHAYVISPGGGFFVVEWSTGTTAALATPGHAQAGASPPPAAPGPGVAMAVHGASPPPSYQLAQTADLEDVHNEGRSVQAPITLLSQSVVLKSLHPKEGSVSGGDNVVISGEGFVCSPAPTVTFGTKPSRVLSCGSTSVTTVTPAADATGAVDVTVTNVGGAAASNKLTFTYVDEVECLVTSANDAGPESLRACVEGARTGTEIRFDPRAFPSDRPASIRLGSPLPPLPDEVTIDGTGAGVVLDGSGLPQPDEDPWSSNDWQGGDHGLVVGSGSVVRGLTITGFSGTGIFVLGGGNTIAANVVSANGTNGVVLGGPDNRLTGNLIGLDPSGKRAWGAQRQGIWMAGSDRNVIGGLDPADRNVISGNQIDIVINSSFNVVQGNYLGTDATGSVKIGKDFEGMPGQTLTTAIYFDCCSDEGGGTIRNTIIGNVVVGGGISIVGPTTWFNAVVGNLLGLDATGTSWLGGSDSDDGPPYIGVGPAPFNRIGGSLPGEANVGDFSIDLGDRDVIALGNRLGVDALGRPLRTPYFGSGSITVHHPGSTIGGRSPEAGNLVVGDGITIRAGSTTVLGNTIRAITVPCCDPDAEAVAIRVAAGTGTQLVANTVEATGGGPSPAGEPVARAGVGVLLGDAASGTVIRGNIVRDSAIGLFAGAGSEGSLIYGNSFDSNRRHARDEGLANAWDDGLSGNWWSGPRVFDADGDGILDSPREVPPASLDRYPLAQPP